MDDAKAPDYARMVDIHKKPGYDPVEMFTDPEDKFVMPKVILKLLKKKFGFRTVMNIIPLKANLVKGSHGRIPENQSDYPVFITNNKGSLKQELFKSTEIYQLITKLLTD